MPCPFDPLQQIVTERINGLLVRGNRCMATVSKPHNFSSSAFRLVPEVIKTFDAVQVDEHTWRDAFTQAMDFAKASRP